MARLSDTSSSTTDDTAALAANRSQRLVVAPLQRIRREATFRG